MEKDQDHVSDADRMDLLLDVIIYICADTALGKQPLNLDSKSMSRRKKDGYTNKWFNYNN